LTGDAELGRAHERLSAACGNAEDLRDLIAHLDDYAVGAGQRQTGQRTPPLNETYVATFLYYTEGDTYVSLGDHTLNLTRAANAAIELADVVEHARTKGLERAEREANAALLRRRERPSGEGDSSA
jgi:hypothetical protein